jgi:hypothetical protein
MAKQPIVLLNLALPRSKAIHKTSDIKTRRITDRWLSIDIACQWRAATPPMVSHAMKKNVLANPTYNFCRRKSSVLNLIHTLSNI